MGANGLIGATGAPLGDCFLGHIIRNSLQILLQFLLQF
jgi:hypothetical protein